MTEAASLDTARTHYRKGKTHVERGAYRQAIAQLQAAATLTPVQSPLGGEVRLWLAIAYEATQQQTLAIDLCRQLSQHPSMAVRKQGKRLLYILEAPPLSRHPEWCSQIPDLSRLSENPLGGDWGSHPNPAQPRSRSPRPPEVPVDPGAVETKDNPFVWVALGAATLILGVLLLWVH
ncbi:hypothetical protein [Trichothermofontia sp.]